MERQVLFLLSFFLLNTGFAQLNLDSLSNIWLDQKQLEVKRLDALNELAYTALGGPNGFLIDPDSLLILANDMYALATKIGSKRYQVDAIIQQSRAYGYMRNLERGLQTGTESNKLAVEIGYKYGEARALGLLGMYHFLQGTPLEAINYFNKSKEAGIQAQEASIDSSIFGEIKSFPLDKMLSSFNNIKGEIYKGMGAHVKALDHHHKALKEYLTQGDKLMVAAVKNNIGTIHLQLEEYDKAMGYFNQALVVFEEFEHLPFQTNVLGNMATVYMKMDSLDKAEIYLTRNLNAWEQLGDQNSIGQVYLQFTSLHVDKKNYRKALEYAEKAEKIFVSANDKTALTYINLHLGNIKMKTGKLNEAFPFFNKSLQLANEVQSLNLQVNSLDYLYQLNKKLGRKTKALAYHEELMILNDSLSKYETGKKLQQLELTEKFFSDSIMQVEEKKQVQLSYEKEILKKTNTRNILIGSGLILLILSGGLFSRLNFTRKSQKIIERERDRSDKLLLNILPAEVAEELKQFGAAKARNFDKVTIIFTDFKEFTQISNTISASELVDELNYCFKGFDAIMEKYGIEKIKTIGDAYMAAGGLPVFSPDAVINSVKAALEINRFIKNRRTVREATGKFSFEMRCGMHTGPVVAGIVGVKKFQYDIWGDTVNTASRMESSGETAQVNISQDTYDLIKDNPGFSFKKRRKIKVKGKGDMNMYFVENVKT